MQHALGGTFSNKERMNASPPLLKWLSRSTNLDLERDNSESMRFPDGINGITTLHRSTTIASFSYVRKRQPWNEDRNGSKDEKLEVAKESFQLSDRDIHAMWDFFQMLLETEMKAKQTMLTSRNGGIQSKYQQEKMAGDSGIKLCSEAFCHFFFPEETRNIFLESLLRLAVDYHSDVTACLEVPALPKSGAQVSKRPDYLSSNEKCRFKNGRRRRQRKETLKMQDDVVSSKPEDKSSTMLDKELDAAFGVEFGQFVQAICTFAMFNSIEDMCKFIFFIADKDKRGYIAKSEVEDLMKVLHRQKPVHRSTLIQNETMTTILPPNHKTRFSQGHTQRKSHHSGNTNSSGKHLWIALNNRSFPNDQIEYEELCSLVEQFPHLLYPLFNLQQRIQCAVMGEYWWDGKKTSVRQEKERSEFLDASKVEIELHRLTKDRDAKIRNEMGSIRYLLDSKKRHFYEEEVYNLPRVFLDTNGNIQTERAERAQDPGKDW
jgi:hypothetical protein